MHLGTRKYSTYCLHGWLLIFVFFSGIVILEGQAPILRQYTVDEGLCSTHVYLSMQDRQGYIWVATDRGISKFDGYNFKNFTINNGLSSNDVWGLDEDEQGRIWLSTFNELTYIENDSVKTLPQSTFAPEGIMLTHYVRDNYHLVKFGKSLKQIASIDDRMQMKEWEILDIVNLCSGQFLTTKNKSSAAFFDHHRKNESLDEARGSTLWINGFFYKDPQNKFRDLLLRLSESKSIVDLMRGPNEVVLITDNNIYRFDGAQIKEWRISSIFKKPAHVETIIEVSNSDRIILKTNEGFFLVDENFELVPNFEYLSKLNINTANVDRNGNLWISTSEGLYFLSTNAQYSKTFFPLTNRSKEVSAIVKDHADNIWMGGANNTFYHLGRNEIRGIVLPGKSLATIENMAIDGSGSILVGAFPVHYFPKNLLDNNGEKLFASKDLSKFKYPQLANVKAIAQQGDHYWMSRGRIFSRELIEEGRLINKLRTGINPTYSLAVDSLGHVWLGQAGGIYKYTGGEDFQAIETHPVFKMPITELQFDEANYLWIATDGNGLFRYKNDVVDTIPELLGTVVKSLKMEGTGRLWAASNDGIHELSGISMAPFSYQYRNITTAHGLVSREVNALELVGDTLFAGTKKGLTIFNINQFGKQVNSSPLYLSSILINGEAVSLAEEYELDYTDNNLIFNFVNLSFKSDKRIFYHSLMEGVDQDWQISASRQREFPTMPPGSYTFKLRASDIDGILSDETKTISFVIHPPWWRTAWFRILTLASLLLLIYLLVQWRINRVRKKAEEENAINKKFAELELQALQAQMNPHFVFNALHAIQDFIFNKDERTANRYLVKFSRLMRLFLDSSKEKHIILDDEIKLIQLYIELEKLRFEDKFDVEFRVSENTETSIIEVPSMILQPFVENAINHGLLYKKTKGLLRVYLQIKNDYLYCVIEDDGVGREKAAEIKKKSYRGYKSRGVSLVEERRKVFNLIEQTNVEINVIDLKDKNGEASGTRVEVNIPIRI